jgi:hypothetical protein
MFAFSKVEWLVLAGALLLTPGFSWSQEASLFERLDRNRDGYLSREELATDLANNRNWIAVDRDRDGRIGRSEFGMVNVPTAGTPSSAAAGGSAPQKPPPQPKQE